MESSGTSSGWKRRPRCRDPAAASARARCAGGGGSPFLLLLERTSPQLAVCGVRVTIHPWASLQPAGLANDPGSARRSGRRLLGRARDNYLRKRRPCRRRTTVTGGSGGNLGACGRVVLRSLRGERSFERAGGRGRRKRRCAAGSAGEGRAARAAGG